MPPSPAVVVPLITRSVPAVGDETAHHYNYDGFHSANSTSTSCSYILSHGSIAGIVIGSFVVLAAILAAERLDLYDGKGRSQRHYTHLIYPQQPKVALILRTRRPLFRYQSSSMKGQQIVESYSQCLRLDMNLMDPLLLARWHTYRRIRYVNSTIPLVLHRREINEPPTECEDLFSRTRQNDTCWRPAS